MSSPSLVRAAFVSTALAASIASVNVHADDLAARHYDIPAGPLEGALNRFGREAGILLSYPTAMTADRKSAGLRGSYTVSQALTQLLAGSGMQAVRAKDGSYTLQPAGAPVTLKTMQINADATALNGELPPADGFKADYQRSASKMPLRLRETPQAVSVITRGSLDSRQARTMGQALELSAGVAQSSGNGPFAGQPTFGFNNTAIRGLDINNLYDVRDDGFASGSQFSQPDLAIYERIEVIKGPNSALYGRGSVAGLINRVRKKPLLETRTELQATAGSYDTYRLDADVTGPINDSKTVRGRMVGAYEDAGSFVAGAKTQRTVLAPSVDFDVAERTRVLVQALYQEEDTIPNTGTPLKPARFDADGNATRFDAPDINRRQFNGVPNRNTYTWRVTSALAQLDHDFNDDWFATLRFSKSRIDTPIEADSYAYGFTDGDDPTTPEIERRGDTSLFRGAYDIERDIWSGEIQLNGRFDIAGHDTKVAVGADRSNNEFYRLDHVYADPDGAVTTANLYDGNFTRLDDYIVARSRPQSSEASSSGAFAQAQITATERLKILLGARFDEVTVDSYYGTVSPTNPARKRTVSDVTGRVGATYELNRNISLYALYAQSFEPVLFSFDINGDLLDPEQGEIHEFGTKTEWFDGRLALSAALYRIDREDVPVAAPVPPGGDYYSIPDGSQRAKGAEIEINGRPLPGWNISLAYNTVDVEHRNPHIANYDSGYAGAADWQLGFFTSYEIHSGPLRGLGVGVTRFEIDQRGVSPYYEVATIPGYERYDLHAFYKGFRNTEINLTIRNLTDEIYIEGSDRAGAYAQFGSPTAALLSVKYVLE